MKKQRKKNSGSALFFGLMIVVVMAVLSSVFLSMVLTEMKNTERSNSAANALSVAEAGIEFAIWEVMHDGADYAAADGWTAQAVPTTNRAFLLDNAGNRIGEYSVNITNTGIFTIECRAGVPDLTNPSSDRQIVKVTLKSEPLFKKSILAVDKIELDNGVLIDSYDSGPLGDQPYGGANVLSNGDIGTESTGNDDIKIGDTVLVKGDAYVGVGGNPTDVIDYSGTGSITGSELISSEAANFPSVVAPVGLPNEGDLNVMFGTKTISSSGQYNKITVAAFGKLVIDSDCTIYVDKLNVVAFSKIEIQNDAKVNIIVEDHFNVVAFAALDNLSGDTANLAVYAMDSTNKINLLGAVSIDGTVYAPNSDFKLGALAVFRGAVMAKKVEIENWAAIHFDESLMTRTTAPNSGKVEVSHWQTK
ncbi:MAG: hypothetical protein KJ915_13255 [Candidatus Omnitrophica bacterium]|nr:hypothetical protein [Candidatus Omnitrophota bacterium]